MFSGIVGQEVAIVRIALRRLVGVEILKFADTQANVMDRPDDAALWLWKSVSQHARPGRKRSKRSANHN